ncbi:MAG: hypothetical protein WA672_16675 [Candidatus Angelobacter sp.]
MIGRTLLLVAIFVFCANQVLIPQSKQITIITTEPAVVKLTDLFRQADIVALVKTVSGDTENYDVAVYKAHVIKSFKGAAAGDFVYFGPYVGERLGWEYIVFLRTVNKPLEPKLASSKSYGTIPYAEIFNEGYGAMMSSYECVFDGADAAQKCGYGIRICTDYIVLPKSIPVFPAQGHNLPFGCRWVRRAVFISTLDQLGKTPNL